MKFYGTIEEVEDINGYILVDGFLNPKNNHIIIKTCPVCGMAHQHGNSEAEIGQHIMRVPHCFFECSTKDRINKTFFDIKFKFVIKLAGTITTKEEKQCLKRKKPESWGSGTKITYEEFLELPRGKYL